MADHVKADYVKVFGKNIAAQRDSLGLTQGELAKRMGRTSKPYISRVEHGYRNITLRQCERFARALRVPLYALFAMGGE